MGLRSCNLLLNDFYCAYVSFSMTLAFSLGRISLKLELNVISFLVRDKLSCCFYFFGVGWSDGFLSRRTSIELWSPWNILFMSLLCAATSIFSSSNDLSLNWQSCGDSTSDIWFVVLAAPPFILWEVIGGSLLGALVMIEGSSKTEVSWS